MKLALNIFAICVLTGPICVSSAASVAETNQPAAAQTNPASLNLSREDVTILNRLTWGVNPSSATSYQKLGFARYLEEQLHPKALALPAEVQAVIDTLNDNHDPADKLVIAMAKQQKSLQEIAGDEQKNAARKAYQDALTKYGRATAGRFIMRALYSPNQLQEQMVWFWLNHFNVFQPKADIRILTADYEDRALRPYALGRFRDLLGATLRHPAMLHYLDNVQNAAGHINENYARELMELHTLGVNGGYSQADVQELARILTGIGVNQTGSTRKIKPELAGQYVRDGVFEFNPNRHAYGDKTLLGHVIKGRGLAEAGEALDILSRHPATARFISRKLAMFFVADEPSQGLIERLAETFTKTDGDIAAVLRTLFTSPEFKTSLGNKFKDPIHYVLSAVRLAYDERVILNPMPVLNALNRLSEPLYGHQTPDGFALTQADWAAPGQMAVRFEIARAIGSGPAGLFKTENSLDAKERPAFPQLANALYYNGLVHSLSQTTRAVLDQATSPQEWNVLFLASPEFMRR